MPIWIVDRRDRVAQRVAAEPEPAAEFPRFVTVHADTAAEAFKAAGVGTGAARGQDD